MSEQTILWVLGALITALGLIVGFLANWHHKTADRVREVEKDLAEFRAEVPIKYANDGDIARVERLVEGLRSEVNTFRIALEGRLDQMVATLNQLVGANTHRG